MQVLGEALRLAVHIGHKSLHARVLRRLGKVDFERDLLWSASEYFEEASAFFHETGESGLEDACLKSMFICFSRLKCPQDALYTLRRRLPVVRTESELNSVNKEILRLKQQLAAPSKPQSLSSVFASPLQLFGVEQADSEAEAEVEAQERLDALAGPRHAKMYVLRAVNGGFLLARHG